MATVKSEIIMNDARKETELNYPLYHKVLQFRVVVTSTLLQPTGISMHLP